MTCNKYDSLIEEMYIVYCYVWRGEMEFFKTWIAPFLGDQSNVSGHGRCSRIEEDRRVRLRTKVERRPRHGDKRITWPTVRNRAIWHWWISRYVDHTRDDRPLHRDWRKARVCDKIDWCTYKADTASRAEMTRCYVTDQRQWWPDDNSGVKITRHRCD